MVTSDYSTFIPSGKSPLELVLDVVLVTKLYFIQVTRTHCSSNTT